LESRRGSRQPRFRPRRILQALLEHDVDFVLIGGLAAIAHGSAHPSFDVDIAYARDRANLERLAAALRALEASLRGAPPDIPFLLDADTLERGAHFTFQTRFGSIDILHDPTGAPPYEQLRKGAGEPQLFMGRPVLVASLDHLIAMKETTGRTKDKLVGTELRVISDELRAPRPSTE
jgi:hypothetical protein